MPFLSNDPFAFKILTKPVPAEFFIRWRDIYISRNFRFNLSNGKTRINLSDEDLFVTFKTSDILALIHAVTDSEIYLTTQFMCEGDANTQYSKLSATICIMKKSNSIPLTSFILPISTPSNPNPNTQATIGKANYEFRTWLIRDPTTRFINSKEFIKDEEGISHEITPDLVKYFEDADKVGKNINVIFAKIPENETNTDLIGRTGRITVVFAREDINIMNDELLISTGMKLYDFGQACCPPQ